MNKMLLWEQFLFQDNCGKWEINIISDCVCVCCVCVRACVCACLIGLTLFTLIMFKNRISSQIISKD